MEVHRHRRGSQLFIGRLLDAFATTRECRHRVMEMLLPKFNNLVSFGIGPFTRFAATLLDSRPKPVYVPLHRYDDIRRKVSVHQLIAENLKLSISDQCFQVRSRLCRSSPTA